MFLDCPEVFASDIAKVTFAMSFLTGTALGQFDNFILHPELPAPHMSDYNAFTSILQCSYRLYDPVAEAECFLENLEMKSQHHAVKYVNDFSRHAAIVGWNPALLQA